MRHRRIVPARIAPALIAAAFALGGPMAPLAAQQAPDTAAAVAGAREFQVACRNDGGRLWGRSLCGPLLLVDATSRFAVATEAPPGGAFTAADGLFVGRVPDDFRAFANTAFDWSGRRWSVVVLPLPSDRFDRISLLAHEAFHRIQPDLALGGGDAGNAHLDERDGRYLFRLEIRALAAAVTAPPAERRSRLLDALAFRAARERRFPGADTLEPRLEIHEGLAEYTGISVAMRETGEGPERVVVAARRFEGRPSYVRASGYGTGPLLGVALDQILPGWRQRLGPRGPIALLREAAGSAAGTSADVERLAARYDGATLARVEDERALDRARRIAGYRALLVDGPTIALADERLSGTFNPNTLVPLGADGTVYPTGTFTAGWGTLVVDSGGARLGSTWGQLWIAAPAAVDSNATTLTGAGWKLTLAPGWRIRPGYRAGDWLATRPEARQ